MYRKVFLSLGYISSLSNIAIHFESLLSVGHLPCGGLVVVVVVWWGALSSLPTSSLSSSSSFVGHLSCRGLIIVVVWWGGLVIPPHIVIIIVCGGLLVVIHGSFVLRRPHSCHCRCRSLPHCHRPVEASSSSWSVLADRPCCVVVVVVW